MIKNFKNLLAFHCYDRLLFLIKEKNKIKTAKRESPTNYLSFYINNGHASRQ